MPGSQFGNRALLSFGLVKTQPGTRCCSACKAAKAIEFDPGNLQPVHELRIVQAVEPRRGADTHNPKTTEISLLQLPTGISEIQSALDRFFRRPIKLRLSAAITAREF